MRRQVACRQVLSLNLAGSDLQYFHLEKRKEIKKTFCKGGPQRKFSISGCFVLQFTPLCNDCVVWQHLGSRQMWDFLSPRKKKPALGFLSSCHCFDLTFYRRLLLSTWNLATVIINPTPFIYSFLSVNVSSFSMMHSIECFVRLLSGCFYLCFPLTPLMKSCILSCTTLCWPI